MPDTTYEYLQGVFNGEHPIQRQIAYGIAEGVGSIANRVPLFKYSKTAPWWVKSSQIHKNNIAMSALDGYGNNENNNTKDVIVDVSLGEISGGLGTYAGMRTFGRNTTRPLERSILNRLAGEGKNLLHNSLYGRTKE